MFFLICYRLKRLGPGFQISRTKPMRRSSHRLNASGGSKFLRQVDAAENFKEETRKRHNSYTDKVFDVEIVVCWSTLHRRFVETLLLV